MWQCRPGGMQLHAFPSSQQARCEPKQSKAKQSQAKPSVYCCGLDTEASCCAPHPTSVPLLGCLPEPLAHAMQQGLQAARCSTQCKPLLLLSMRGCWAPWQIRCLPCCCGLYDCAALSRLSTQHAQVAPSGATSTGPTQAAAPEAGSSPASTTESSSPRSAPFR